jgi:hypothetical protein
MRQWEFLFFLDIQSSYPFSQMINGAVSGSARLSKYPFRHVSEGVGLLYVETLTEKHVSMVSNRHAACPMIRPGITDTSILLDEPRPLCGQRMLLVIYDQWLLGRGLAWCCNCKPRRNKGKQAKFHDARHREVR